MTTSNVVGIAACLPIICAASATASLAPASPASEEQLLALHQRFVEGLALPGSVDLEALLAEDFLFTSRSGDWIERAAYLGLRRRPAEAGSGSDDEVRVRLHGSVALIQGVVEGGGEAPQRFRYTHVYYWTGASWQLVHVQDTLLREGVAKELQHGEMPLFAPWSGEDPQGEDNEVLLQLNASYVQAYRDANVAWYDAHVATDYGVVNSDGSFHDRARALSEFAKDSYAAHMKSFPVEKVRIRRFGDVALIYAENAYELKDGRRGVSRYTDIWIKEGGRWLCLGAHITPHAGQGGSRSGL